MQKQATYYVETTDPDIGSRYPVLGWDDTGFPVLQATAEELSSDPAITAWDPVEECSPDADDAWPVAGAWETYYVRFPT